METLNRTQRKDSTYKVDVLKAHQNLKFKLGKMGMILTLLINHNLTSGKMEFICREAKRNSAFYKALHTLEGENGLVFKPHKKSGRYNAFSVRQSLYSYETDLHKLAAEYQTERVNAAKQAKQALKTAKRKTEKKAA